MKTDLKIDLSKKYRRQDVMEKTYTLSKKDALTLKLWPALITLCCIYLVWAYGGSPAGIAVALIVIGIAWWRHGYVPHKIVLKDDDSIEFISYLKKTVVAVKDIRSIVEIKYYKEYSLRHSKGAIAIFKSMPNVADFIASITKKNPNIDVKFDTLTR